MYTFKQTGSRYILSLDNHVSLIEALTAFCEERGILSGSIHGLGAVSSATFRFLNPALLSSRAEREDLTAPPYVDRTFGEQMELTCIEGNISRKGGEADGGSGIGQVYLHVHVTASRSDYSCIGGHLLDCRINGACELFVEDLGLPVGRHLDPSTGLNLYTL